MGIQPAIQISVKGNNHILDLFLKQGKRLFHFRKEKKWLRREK